jgi:hypothetical protein
MARKKKKEDVFGFEQPEEHKILDGFAQSIALLETKANNHLELFHETLNYLNRDKEIITKLEKDMKRFFWIFSVLIFILFLLVLSLFIF